MLLRALGGWGTSAPPAVRAAFGLSPLVDLDVTWPWLERPGNGLYQASFMRSLRQRLRAQRADLEPHLDLGPALSARTVRAFDAAFTAPLSDFDDVWDYYRRAGARPLLGAITVPTVLLHAEDDPIVPSGPVAEARGLPFLLPAVTRRGGHVGFLGRAPHRRWAEHHIVELLRDVVARDVA